MTAALSSRICQMTPVPIHDLPHCESANFVVGYIAFAVFSLEGLFCLPGRNPDAKVSV